VLITAILAHLQRNAQRVHLNIMLVPLMIYYNAYHADNFALLAKHQLIVLYALTHMSCKQMVHANNAKYQMQQNVLRQSQHHNVNQDIT
jgi:hypothetical protein